jgi:hypothetical protein
MRIPVPKQMHESRHHDGDRIQVVLEYEFSSHVYYDIPDFRAWFTWLMRAMQDGRKELALDMSLDHDRPYHERYQRSVEHWHDDYKALMGPKYQRKPTPTPPPPTALQKLDKKVEETCSLGRTS